MNRALMILAVLSILLNAGCASKADLEAAKTQLTACDEERTKLEAAVISWEERFDRASSSWSDIEASVSDALPAALNELHSEKERIIELVPQQVQSEVAAYLEEYFATVMKGFGQLSDDNADIKRQLVATHKVLESVGADTRAIGTSIDQTVAEERAQRQAEAAKRQQVSTYLAELVDQVVEFDQNQINCKQCPDRLKLNRKEREAILGFHAELMADLADLQKFAGEINDLSQAE